MQQYHAALGDAENDAGRPVAGKYRCGSPTVRRRGAGKGACRQANRIRGREYRTRFFGGHVVDRDHENWRLPGYFFTHRDCDFQEIDEYLIDRGRTRSWRNVRA